MAKTPYIPCPDCGVKFGSRQLQTHQNAVHKPPKPGWQACPKGCGWFGKTAYFNHVLMDHFDEVFPKPPVRRV